MRGKKLIRTKKKPPVKRRRGLRFNKGATSPEMILILLLVFFIFLGFMFMNFSGSFGSPKAGSTQNEQVVLPSMPFEIEAGMKLLEITPLPSTFSPSMCTIQTNDVVLVIDTSGSMRGTKLDQAKEAAKLFVQLIAINPQSRVGIVEFSKTAKLISPLTNDLSSMTISIDKLTNGSNTCIQCGVTMAAQQFASGASVASSTSATVKRSVVLLSDGKSNHTNGVRDSKANQAAQTAISSGYAANNASYYTIAIGEDADEDFMSQAALSTNGAPFSTSSFDALSQTFAHVATDICTESQ